MSGGQQTLAGMPQRLYAATPTRLTTWMDCPRRYRFAYLDRPPPRRGPPWAHNSLGSSVHLALAGWWRLPLTRRTPSAAGALLSTHWAKDGYRDPEQSTRWRERARALVERYVSTLDPRDEPQGVERTVALRHGGAALSGRVDRIDERPTPDGRRELVVVDYKAGRHISTDDDARCSLALAVYAAAAARVLRQRCHRVELHHVPSGTVAGWEHTDETLDRHLRRAETLAEECRGADAGFAEEASRDAAFPPRPGPRCAWCDWSPSCPEGRTAAPARRSWDGLGEPD